MSTSNKPTNIDGWNDPPANLTLSDTISTKRVLLNQRVAYTNQDLGSPKNATNILTAPPAVQPSAIAAASSVTANSLPTDTVLTIEEISSIFNNQIKKIENTSNVEKKITEDIRRKFQLMCDEWTQDKLSMNTKLSLCSIFQELDSNRIQQAFDMHVALVRNAGAEVVRFIVGIKRLIQELQRLST